MSPADIPEALLNEEVYAANISTGEGE